MLLTLTSTTPPASDLGFLLRKHPDRLQSFPLGFGVAQVFYPESTLERCTAALMLEIDPVGLVRGKAAAREDGLVDAYVNDRPYVASSFLSVAIARVLGSALAGKAERNELVERPLALELVVTPVRHEQGVADRLFAPLGYEVAVKPVAVPEAAHVGRHATLTLRTTATVRDVLSHLYVLLPVLDDDKHYWVGDEELEKLFRHGRTWLAAHPEREFIARRYLRRSVKHARAAVQRLCDMDDARDEARDDGESTEQQVVERPLRLQDLRIAAVTGVLRDREVRRVVDLGCGSADLLLALAHERAVERICGCDVAMRELDRAKERLDRSHLAASQRARIELLQSSVLYRDVRIAGFDAATLLEVVEHVDPTRLHALERAIFGAAHPGTVVVTTPNREYNARFPALANGGLRHTDHRFEWTRDEFRIWAARVATEYGYGVIYRGIGEVDDALGAPTQMAIFTCV